MPSTGAPAATQGAEKYDWRSQLKSDKTMDQEFIGVTHSLGAYLLFNALSVDSFGVAAPSQAEAARLTA